MYRFRVTKFISDDQKTEIENFDWCPVEFYNDFKKNRENLAQAENNKLFSDFFGGTRRQESNLQKMSDLLNRVRKYKACEIFGIENVDRNGLINEIR